LDVPAVHWLSKVIESVCPDLISDLSYLRRKSNEVPGGIDLLAVVHPEMMRAGGFTAPTHIGLPLSLISDRSPFSAGQLYWMRMIMMLLLVPLEILVLANMPLNESSVIVIFVH
jgi:hypothetical protein